jgi:tRNA-dihydrouridine synthase 2
MLAPMVRSGARTSPQLSNKPFSFPILISSVPTRLFALKHGAKLVWGPEMVDKAMLQAERVVDRV